MERQITERDIELFLTRNAGKHASQLTLIGSALIFLWPDGAPPGAAERVVNACLAHPTLTLSRLEADVGAAA
jgi:hypothetical protein